MKSQKGRFPRKSFRTESRQNALICAFADNVHHMLLVITERGVIIMKVKKMKQLKLEMKDTFRYVLDVC
jgi:hypothetical protein